MSHDDLEARLRKIVEDSRAYNAYDLHSEPEEALEEAADRLAVLEAELTVARNRLGNAVGAIIDTSNHVCTGPEDVAAAIHRLTADRTQLEGERNTIEVAAASALRASNIAIARLRELVRDACEDPTVCCVPGSEWWAAADVALDGRRG